ncbi:lactonase family protein [Silvibacterium acidisoli]|uniref:lactonase family protein n=1 Tax=Acidobacteriaceae bacterium ZG23-2 TaxID=2883246 RepID=UPI00406CF7BC
MPDDELLGGRKHHDVARRELLKSAAAFGLTITMAKPLAAWGAVEAHSARSGQTLAYVGTYSSSLDSGAGNGKGIYLFEVNDATGELTPLGLAAELRNASWIEFDRSRRFLYALSEVADFGRGTGSVSAFAVDRPTGKLQLLNTVSSEGIGPAHLSLDATGKYLFVANYVGGNAAVLPIHADGTLGSATDVHQDEGSLGSKAAARAPDGSFAISGHDKTHAHMIQPDPSNRFVLQTDLAQDRIYVWRFDPVNGKLEPSSANPFVTLPSGDGPRHFAFHPNGHWMYSLQEEASTIVFFHFDPSTGRLVTQQTLSTLPRGFKGTTFTSEILISKDGRFIYAANRLHDTIAIFSIAGDGRLTYITETSTLGDYPRYIGMHPDGRFLYATNQRSDAITAFNVDKQTGLLRFTGRYTAVGSPACIVFLR